MAEKGSGFAATAIVGVVSAALAATAGAKPWLATGDLGGHRSLGVTAADVSEAAQMPVALALGLVMLAVWGVVLVTRGVVRRAVGVLGVLASAGYLATVVTGAFTLKGRAAELVEPARLTLSFGGWFWVAALAGLLGLAAAVIGVLRMPRWPEMGSAYDAPTAPAATSGSTDRDLWRAMDHGEDPTA